MDGMVITHPGFENEAVAELDALGMCAQPFAGGVLTFSDDAATIAAACLARTAKRVLLLVSVQKATTTLKLPDLSAHPVLPFRVVCERHGSHNFSSQEIEHQLGAAIFEKLHWSVNLKQPEYVIYVYIWDDTAYIGLDLSGDLSKRTYKVMHHKQSLKGSLAACLLALAAYTPDKTLLDPLCKDGTIAIEAASNALAKGLPSRLPWQHLPAFRGIILPEKKAATPEKIYCVDESFHNVANAKKNAKIAGIEKHLTFSRMPLEDVDLKVESHSIDCIVTLFMPHAGEAQKRWQLLFEQASRVLSTNGVLCMLTNTVPADMPFTIEKQRIVLIGNVSMHAVLLRRGQS